MLDVSNGLDKWIRWASRFHGVLELGPSFGGPDFSRVQTWNDLGARTAPAAADLRAAERIKQELVAQSGQLAENGVVYVAGGPEETPTFDPDAGEIRYTDRGDGKVTWESGIPPGVPTWYVPVKHGDLLNTRSAFGGIRELLLHGHTDQLTTQQPVTSSLLRDVPGDGPPLARGDQVEFVPSTEDIEAAVLGMSSAWRGRKPSRPPVTPCEVSVVHGDLRFTENPVMVGHYRGDQIVHAEEALDHCLDGALSSRHQLDVYPGEIGTADIVLKPDRDCRAPRSPTGAIVIGLGNVGELSSGALGRAVEAGLLRYAQACRERGRDTSALKVSALLIGTGEAGISTLEALEAFLLALRNTNQALHRLQQSKSADDEPSSRAVPLTHFAHIEFVELYKDVALEALHTLSAMPERADLVIRKRIESRAGGRHRARITSAQAWWPRIQISSDGEAAGSTRTLTFTTFGGRARAPVTKSYVQRALVDRLVADTLRNSGGRNDEMAETLFELLVPAALKAGAAERRNLQLVLDASAAAYPWELLADRRSNADMPVGVAAGLLRQLRVDDVRPVSHPDDNSILVVGDPPSAMVELPGARKEADVVARQFAKRGGWTVIEQIRGGAAGISSTSIVQSLLTRDIRLLHLAGHGIYNAADPLRSGMIIGGSGSQDDPWVMITAAEISQMRLQPELVFINCCHLGRIEEPEPYHKLAASLAAAFIKAGVKAVVAAGWPVNDDAAATFATEFYRKMLGGEDFGSAVNAARRQTYAHESNTWGAYQCYGEPGFRLLMDLGVRSRVRGTYYAPDDYLDPSELTVELGNLVSRARVDVTAAQQKELSARLGELGSIAERKDWLEEVNVLASLARVYGELGHLEAAIDHYDRAARVENGGVTLHDLEQLANYRVRLGAKRESHREVRAAIRDLERLIREHGETGERLSLLGASHKRAAQIAEGRKALREELQQMTAAYCRAADLQTRNWFYAASNALLGIVLLGGPWSRKPRAGTVAADSYESSDWSSEKRYAEALGRVEVALRQQDLRDFWDAVGIPDLQVIKALAGNTVTDRLDELVDAYRETIRLYGSGREIDSVLNQWLFAQKVLASMGSAADAAALKQLCDALSG
jgi:tetratricopeptide (TPR) repeat protein